MDEVSRHALFSSQVSCHFVPWVWALSSTPRIPTSQQCTSTTDTLRSKRKMVSVGPWRQLSCLGVSDTIECMNEWWPLFLSSFLACVFQALNSGGLVEAQTWLQFMLIKKMRFTSTTPWRRHVTSTTRSTTPTLRNGTLWLEISPAFVKCLSTYACVGLICVCVDYNGCILTVGWW